MLLPFKTCQQQIQQSGICLRKQKVKCISQLDRCASISLLSCRALSRVRHPDGDGLLTAAPWKCVCLGGRAQPLSLTCCTLSVPDLYFSNLAQSEKNWAQRLNKVAQTFAVPSISRASELPEKKLHWSSGTGSTPGQFKAVGQKQSMKNYSILSNWQLDAG